MSIFVAVNRINEIGYRQTTALLIAGFVRLGHTVSIAGVADFSVDTSLEQSSEEKRGTRFSVRLQNAAVQQRLRFKCGRGLCKIGCDGKIAFN